MQALGCRVGQDRRVSSRRDAGSPAGSGRGADPRQGNGGELRRLDHGRRPLPDEAAAAVRPRRSKPWYRRRPTDAGDNAQARRSGDGDPRLWRPCPVRGRARGGNLRGSTGMGLPASASPSPYVSPAACSPIRWRGQLESRQKPCWCSARPAASASPWSNRQGDGRAGVAASTAESSPSPSIMAPTPPSTIRARNFTKQVSMKPTARRRPAIEDQRQAISTLRCRPFGGRARSSSSCRPVSRDPRAGGNLVEHRAALGSSLRPSSARRTTTPARRARYALYGEGS